MFNILAERELLMMQGLNDLDIQEDQNAVFICELSAEDIPGEWYKNGERIQPTSTIKIRQEGQFFVGRQSYWSVSVMSHSFIYLSVHFLL